MKHLDQEIEQTMNSLDGIRQTESNPFLITRIEAQLAQKTQPLPTLVWQSAMRMTLILVLVVANLVTVANVFVKKEQPNSSQAMGFFSEQVSDYRY